MKKVLVAYATMPGSTAEVALAIGEVLIRQGNEVDILPLEKVTDLAPYEVIILSAPMVIKEAKARPVQPGLLPSTSKINLQVNPGNKPLIDLLGDAGIITAH